MTLFCGIIFTYSKIFVEPNIYKIEFKDIDGISKGSPVRIMGVNVGYVRNLKAVGKEIDVEIIITKKNIKIPNGTIARVEFYGLGGSKSIELMPPDGSCDVGILTSNTIRINDVINQAVGLVQVIEVIEKYVKSLDKAGMENFLQKISEFEIDNLDNINKDITVVQKDMENTTAKIHKKQREYSEIIKNAGNTVSRINKFIKK